MGSSIEKIAAGFTLVAVITALTLPNRQTPAIAKNVGNAIAKIYSSVITGKA